MQNHIGITIMVGGDDSDGLVPPHFLNLQDESDLTLQNGNPITLN
jgi:hypothetical protein